MIEWYPDLYMDSVVAKEPEMYKDMTEDGKVHMLPVYCISIASNRNNLLDIISSNELRYSYYKRNTMYVIGLAASYKEALVLVTDIIMNVYRDTGGFNVRDYYKMGCDI